jgi:hypothetical protein
VTIGKCNYSALLTMELPCSDVSSTALLALCLDFRAMFIGPGFKGLLMDGLGEGFISPSSVSSISSISSTYFES